MLMGWRVIKVFIFKRIDILVTVYFYYKVIGTQKWDDHYLGEYHCTGKKMCLY